MTRLNKQLNKCPMCGHDLTITPNGSSFGPIPGKVYRSYTDVDCSNVHCHFRMMFDEEKYSMEDVLQIINTRPIEDQLRQEIHRLKEFLFVCGQIAVSDWNDSIVGFVDLAIKDFKIPKQRYLQILKTLNEIKKIEQDENDD